MPGLVAEAADPLPEDDLADARIAASLAERGASELVAIGESSRSSHGSGDADGLGLEIEPNAHCDAVLQRLLSSASDGPGDFLLDVLVFINRF